MKKTMNVFLSAILAAGMIGCSSGNAKQEEKPEETPAETEKEETASAEENIDDPAWETLNSLGQVQTENGLFYVSVTLPAELAGEGITQEKLDAGAGERYTSAVLHEDGSVTYKMTKKQHKAMLDSLFETIDNALQEMTQSGQYAISEITHNKDFTSFDVRLTTEELGMTEGFMVMAFFMYGKMYNLFTGQNNDIIVNYYSAAGDLIETANSANMNG